MSQSKERDNYDAMLVVANLAKLEMEKESRIADLLELKAKTARSYATWKTDVWTETQVASDDAYQLCICAEGQIPAQWGLNRSIWERTPEEARATVCTNSIALL